jgi:hypothetical protein
MSGSTGAGDVGGGGTATPTAASEGLGGLGGGGEGGSGQCVIAIVANDGGENFGAGGGGAARNPVATPSGAGGKGRVIIKSTTHFTTRSPSCAPVSFDGTNYIGDFKASANLTVTDGSSNTYKQFDYLAVAGGGGGGVGGGGGGGAGGGLATSFPGGTKVYVGLNDLITVGSGGAGGAFPGSAPAFVAALRGGDGGGGRRS